MSQLTQHELLAEPLPSSSAFFAQEMLGICGEANNNFCLVVAVISVAFPEKLSWKSMCTSLVFPFFLLTLFPLFVQQTAISLPRAVYVLSTELGAEVMCFFTLFYFFYYFF